MVSNSRFHTIGFNYIQSTKRLTILVLSFILSPKAHWGNTMETARINVSLPKEMLAELSKEVESRKRSRFVAEAIRRLLEEKRKKRLVAEYKEAAQDIRRINQELEGVISDGLD